MDDKNNPVSAESNIPVIKERKRWLFFGLPFTFTKYALGEKYLRLCKGFFSTTEDDVLLFRIMDISIRRSLFQRMAGLGTITVMSSDKTNPTLVLKNIKNIRAFKEALDQRVEADRLRMRFRPGEYMGDLDNEDSDNN